MNQELIDRCPFREKTASRRLYLVIARSKGPMSKSEIAKDAHLSVAKTATLLAAYVNPMHKAPLDRVGVRLVRAKDGGYALETCKPKPKAKRPARGATKKKPVKKAKARKTSAAPASDAPVPTNAESESVKGCETPRKKRVKRPAVPESPVDAPDASVEVENGKPNELSN